MLIAAMASTVAACSTLPYSGAINGLAKQPDKQFVEIQTTSGRIIIEVLSAQAPKVANWFLSLVDTGLYDGTKFFRSGHLAGQPARPRFLEGGPLASFLLGERDVKPATVAESGLPLLRAWETTTQSGLRHERGSVSLARDITGDGSAAPDLVISLETIAEMDAGGGYSPQNAGFPVIGRVVAGMELVDAIAAGPREGQSYVPFLNGQILSQPVMIEKAVRMPLMAVQP
jgi:peptidyl-prolyl cis-trans isomerase A (cyclophilin A)